MLKKFNHVELIPKDRVDVCYMRTFVKDVKYFCRFLMNQIYSVSISDISEILVVPAKVYNAERVNEIFCNVFL